MYDNASRPRWQYARPYGNLDRCPEPSESRQDCLPTDRCTDNSARAGKAHREGFVVEFRYDNEVWVGNFQRGLSGFDATITHPDGRSVIVIAGGQGYVIDPRVQNAISTFGGGISSVADAHPHRVVFSTLTEFSAYGAKGEEWRTRRLSWDGFRAIRVEGDTLNGEGWTPAGERWVAFSVDLSTGQAIGAAYP